MAKSKSFLSAIHKLYEIATLDENWNGYGAHPIDFDVVMNAFGMLFMLNHPPFISPTANQSIQMEYEKSNGDYFEMEIFKDHIEVYKHTGRIESKGTLTTFMNAIPVVASMANDFCKGREST